MTTTIKKGRWLATPKISDTIYFTLFALRAKVGCMAYDAALLALLALIFWGMLK